MNYQIIEYQNRTSYVYLLKNCFLNFVISYSKRFLKLALNIKQQSDLDFLLKFIITCTNFRYIDKQFDNSRESGVDLSSDEDEQKAEENRKKQDYVEVKINGLQEEIKKLKAMQVVEQTNINEIQSKINKITMETNLRNTNKVKKELEKQTKYLDPNAK